MITIGELLESTVYRKYLMQEPEFNPWNPSPTWRLWVQKHNHGKWAYKDFDNYLEALRVLLKYVDKYHNMALACRKMPFDIPVSERNGKRFRMKMPDKHHWCGYCRRPTVFKRFSMHHVFQGRYREVLNSDEPRCTICGIRKSTIVKV